MTKMITQLELLIKNMMGAPTKIVKPWNPRATVKKKPKGFMKKFGIGITIWWVPTRPIKSKVGKKFGWIVKESEIGVIRIGIMTRETRKGNMIYIASP